MKVRRRMIVVVVPAVKPDAGAAADAAKEKIEQAATKVQLPQLQDRQRGQHFDLAIELAENGAECRCYRAPLAFESAAPAATALP